MTRTTTGLCRLAPWSLAMLVAVWGLTPASAFHTGGLILVNAHQFSWTDPASGGRWVDRPF